MTAPLSLPGGFCIPLVWGMTLGREEPEKLCHLLSGDPAAGVEAINRMAVLHYCRKIAWITPILTGRDGKYIKHISVMTRGYRSPYDTDA